MKSGFYLHFICYYSISFVIHNAVGERKLVQGPYKTTVIMSEKCEKTSAPYEKVPAAFFSCDIHNTTKGIGLLSGNLTIVRVDQNRKISVKGFLLEDGKWTLISSINSRGCKGFLTRFLYLALQMGGADTCKTKGSFRFQDVNFDYLQHKWKKEAEYGLNLYRIDVSSPLGTTICWEYKVLTIPERKIS